MSTSQAPRHAPTSPTRLAASQLLSMLFRTAGVVAVLAAPVLSGVTGSTTDDASIEREQQRTTTWQPSYSERYPGCVPSVLWPADERPVAVVTRTPDGRVDRVALDADRHLVRPLPASAE